MWHRPGSLLLLPTVCLSVFVSVCLSVCVCLSVLYQNPSQVAGPTEIGILADGTADPKIIATDLVQKFWILILVDDADEVETSRTLMTLMTSVWLYMRLMTSMMPIMKTSVKLITLVWFLRWAKLSTVPPPQHGWSPLAQSWPRRSTRWWEISRPHS